MIEIGKKYRTTCGTKVRRILCVDRFGSKDYPVVAEMESGAIYTFGPNGEGVGGLDLVEVKPYKDFKIDDPVMVRREIPFAKWYRRYFAGVSPEGKPMAYADGCSSWTANDDRDLVNISNWDECRRPTPEELKVKGD